MIVADSSCQRLLPLNACLFALQPPIPHLERAALRRCLQRDHVPWPPHVNGDKPKRQRFERCTIGVCRRHSDLDIGTSLPVKIAEFQTPPKASSRLVSIGRSHNLAVTLIVDKADRKTAWRFLQHMLEAFATVRFILSGPHHFCRYGVQRAAQPWSRNTIYSRLMSFDMIYKGENSPGISPRKIVERVASDAVDAPRELLSAMVGWFTPL